jgi:hypothetical protein
MMLVETGMVGQIVGEAMNVMGIMGHMALMRVAVMPL